MYRCASRNCGKPVNFMLKWGLMPRVSKPSPAGSLLVTIWNMTQNSGAGVHNCLPKPRPRWCVRKVL